MQKNRKLSNTESQIEICRGVISPSFIFTLDHTLAFRAWTILFTPVDSGKSSERQQRQCERVRKNCNKIHSKYKLV